MADKIIIREFPDWSAVLDAAEVPGKPLDEKGHARSAYYEEYFYGTPTWDAAMDLARNGWQEGRDRLVRTFDAATALQRTATVQARFLDVAGAYPHAALAAAGAPDCMWSLGDTHIAAKPVVRILTGQGVRSGVDAKWIINRGAALLSHIDRLEDAGYSVELTAIHAASYQGWRHETSYTVKRAGEPLELDRLAFVLAHPSMHRRMVFALREQATEPGFRKAFGGNYGGTCRPLEVPDDVIFLPHIDPDEAGPWLTVESAVANIGAALEARGIRTTSD
ncbi:protein of unknown function [Magnetospirillum sp. XM-1]|uniref:DUF7192 family protein n=1 Tax=Magnetospirillum sp. XM-1 TaxID=1663591 RepID=UPI00073DCCD7|nr:hypothetical protein [Magnetospirillum sp. XM-1]CUW38804.1 protein of unknown function [Magnetospirillum sp. XM-1]